MGSGTSIGRVRGLGAAKEGTHHWWRQRVTAGSNLLLMSWLLISILRQPGFDYSSIRTWLSSAWVAVPMILLVASVFYHFRLGLQVLIEDYQQEEAKVISLILLNFFTVALAAVAIFSILKVAFGAAA